jgi:hypothetical protein
MWFLRIAPIPIRGITYELETFYAMAQTFQDHAHGGSG